MFQGFSQQTIDFLWGIRFNNDRAWFEEHKGEFKETLEGPMKELCGELYRAMDDKYPDLGLVSKVSRIYRDARRLFGRGPYRDHLWLSVTQPTEKAARPVLWFELTPESYSYGMGFWAQEAAAMAKLRARMEHDPATLEAIVRDLEAKGTFTLRGEDFKRRRPAPTGLLEPWYNKKRSLSLVRTGPNDDLLFTPALKDTILSGWQELIPLFRYLSTVAGDPDPREEK